ncbi:fic family toxin-antitoxin system, toxin component [Streptomyces sp. NPDC021100]|uniref:fic family toxin-antitoxin system, toxin component n=1 Tax=Streptomyces sp. NPDC021100 TaxID=3365114 RepID=UPI0037B335BC
MTTRHLTFEELLQIAETLPGDPQCWDIGALDAAVARTQAHRLGRDVYGSHWLQAGALLQILALLEPLEHSNMNFAWAAARAFLEVNGRTVDAKPADIVDLVTTASRKEIDVQAIAARLRSWATGT